MPSISISLRVCALAVALTTANPLLAKTFYIDAALGNDGWSGEMPVSGGAGIGPWQTLTKLGAVTLAPGDQVLLRCGQAWSSTLKVNGAGTAQLPIKIGRYPDSCNMKPAISGFHDIPDFAWQAHQGDIYKVKFPLNQIWNGSLETSVVGWKRFSADNSAVLGFDSACPDSSTGCLKVTSGSTRRPNLVISPTFPLVAGVQYVAEFSVRAPSGARYGVVVRRNGPSYETLGLASSQGGNGAWQKIRIPFRATSSIENARLEVEFYDPSISFYLKNVSVALEQALTPTMLSDAGEPVSQAHHPNAGVDPARPQSVYLLTAAGSSVITVAGKTVSPDVVVGDMKLPAGATISPGVNLHLRENGWRVDKHVVKTISGNRISFDPPTSYPMYYNNWGYYFTGALWMLDSPGEWHFNAADSTLYVWPDNSSKPTSGTRYAALDKGIDLANAKFVTIEGIKIEGVRLGIELQDARSIQLRDLDIADTQDEGIRAIGAIDSVIEASRFSRTGGDAIHAIYSSNLRVANNDIRDNGVLLRNGLVANLPKTTFAAIDAGVNSNISDNRIENVGYLGIRSGNNGRIVRNAVLNACTVLNDCGGIYFSNSSYNSEVSGNLLDTAPGNTDGLYPTLPAHSAGLYFDEHAHDIRATGNTVTGYAYGAQIHNSWNITLDGNIFHHNRTNQLLMQEQRNAAYVDGDTHSNVVRNNQFFPADEKNAVYLLSTKTSTYDFATFEGNVYSNLHSSVVLVENQPGNTRSADTLYDWQNATNSGVPRNQDIRARITAPKAGYALGLAGASIVWNGDFSSGKSSWSSSSSAPAAVLGVEDCSPGPSRCLAVATGGGNAVVGTPRFSIKDQWYRVSFDVRADRENTPIWAVVRRAGTVSYAYLMPANVGITAGTTWKRYSFNFKSTAKVTANEAPGVLGARLDFEQIPAGRKVWLANVEMNPLNRNDGTSISTDDFLVSNPDQVSASVDCPLLDTKPERCGSFMYFDDGSAVDWPLQLNPLMSKIIFTQDLSLPDTDNDGIADVQDQCPNTPYGPTVNAKGCAFGEAAGTTTSP